MKHSTELKYVRIKNVSTYLFNKYWKVNEQIYYVKIHNLNKLHLPLSILTIYTVTKLKLCKRYFCFIFVDIGKEYVQFIKYLLSKLVILLLAYCISTRSGHAR